MRLTSTLALALAALLACAGARKPERSWPPVPNISADSVLLVRGTAAAAGALSNEDQTEIVSRLLRQFYYPTDRQARWLDPRPLSHIRAHTADDTVGADPDFADEAVGARNPLICVLGGRDFGCRGKTGGIVRVSWPYLVGKDSAIIFATYTPRDSLGKSSAPQAEQRFRFRRGGDGYWDLAGNSPVDAKPSQPGTRP
jgi:hypothetical protein